MDDDRACDVLILGAGPAGCAAAIRARQSGLGVVMLEAQARPGIAPGETLHPGVEPLLAALGVRDAVLAAGFHRHRGIWSDWHGPRRFIPYGADADGPWLGFQANRARFHAMLIDTVQAAGAVLLRPMAAASVVRNGMHVVGVVAAGKTIRARFVLDATGRRAWLARALGLVARPHSPPLQLRFGWREANPADDPSEPLIKARPLGWDWQAPVGADRVAWATLRVPAPGEALSRRPETSFRWRRHDACAGPGYMLLGDAAALLDPASSHGVLRALMTGMLSAHLIAACHRGASSEADAVTSYRDWVHGQFEHDVAALKALYAQHPIDAARLALTGAAWQGSSAACPDVPRAR